LCPKTLGEPEPNHPNDWHYRGGVANRCDWRVRVVDPGVGVAFENGLQIAPDP
jgi:hypothetical protein